MSSLKDLEPHHIHRSDPRTTLIAIIAVIMVLGALKLSAVITFPLLFAGFLLFFLWPFQMKLQRHMPPALAAVGSLVAALIVAALFAASLFYSVYLVTDTMPLYTNELEILYTRLNHLARGMGVSLREIEDMSEVTDKATSMLSNLLAGFLTTGGFLALMGVFLVLGLVEIPRFRYRLRRELMSDRVAHVQSVMARIAEKLHGFMIVRTATSAATGVLTGMICWMFGVELAFVWGLIAFVLNYIPTLGSIIAVIPPVLMAMLQFDDWWGPLGLLTCLTVLQMVIGNYIDPRLQGRWNKISPLAAFFSLAFWGWIGGLPGAVLGVPLTIVLIITADQFPQTRWFSHMLADMDDEDEQSGVSAAEEARAVQAEIEKGVHDQSGRD